MQGFVQILENLSDCLQKERLAPGHSQGATQTRPIFVYTADEGECSQWRRWHRQRARMRTFVFCCPWGCRGWWIFFRLPIELGILWSLFPAGYRRLLFLTYLFSQSAAGNWRGVGGAGQVWRRKLAQTMSSWRLRRRNNRPRRNLHSRVSRRRLRRISPRYVFLCSFFSQMLPCVRCVRNLRVSELSRTDESELVVCTPEETTLKCFVNFILNRLKKKGKNSVVQLFFWCF